MSTFLNQVKLILKNEDDLIANLSNVSAIIYHHFDKLNWAGFYLYKDGELVLGPFQGKLACTRIKLNRGVCGHAATTKQTVIVNDVHSFPDHIACDSASNSEIVVPIIKNKKLLGVLDIDSPIKNRFCKKDQKVFEQVVSELIKCWKE